MQSIVDRTSPVLIDHAEAALALGMTSAALDYRLREGTVALDDAVCVGTRQLYRSAQLRPLLLVG